MSPQEVDVLMQQDLLKRAPQADNNPSAPPASGQQSQSQGGGGSAPAGSNGGGVNTAPQTAAGSSSAAQGGGDALGDLPTSTSFGNTVFPGSASFLTPTGSGSVSPLFRIDGRENVTFVWEYESVSVRPVNLTLAAAGPNSVTYTIAALQGGATSAEWHIANIPRESPLMNGYYEIQLYDQRGISASESPGWLSPQTTLTIAFYSGETYANATDTAGNDCPICLYDAASTFKAYGTTLGVALVTSAFFIYGILY
ncbi:hypothetical protein RO3G_07533 [Lichtheimia corymbifera JMRC:FSU:9682]|uniref:DUF7137 domain-containing protein n=1 Tax=Lichtheimia corymbifera JMRC:FSU:9682 TaxID=1263082 RepID=A0A068S5I2_9FUNG|nr:hypothetical protein RO3G_07533 [Lichtheimia corymbifera JMRC:FSU:9682]